MATKQQPRSENEMNLGSFEGKAATDKGGEKASREGAERNRGRDWHQGPAIGAESIRLAATAKLAKKADEKSVRRDSW